MQLDNDQIRQILPHRYPFLMVDKILDFEPGKWAKGIKCVTANEMLFLGHFPEKSVFPGVMQLEAMAQTGAIAILQLPENQGKLALLGAIKNARFYHPATPGDVITMECEITRFLGNVGMGKATAKIEETLISSAEFTFALSDAE